MVVGTVELLGETSALLSELFLVLEVHWKPVPVVHS